MNSMKQLNEQEIKEISLDILNFITNKCDEMNLKYVLVWGTLIGAVRHGMLYSLLYIVVFDR